MRHPNPTSPARTSGSWLTKKSVLSTSLRLPMPQGWWNLEPKKSHRTRHCPASCSETSSRLLPRPRALPTPAQNSPHQTHHHHPHIRTPRLRFRNLTFFWNLTFFRTNRAIIRTYRRLHSTLAPPAAMVRGRRHSTHRNQPAEKLAASAALLYTPTEKEAARPYRTSHFPTESGGTLPAFPN